MARGINQVKGIGIAVRSRISQTDSAGFDRDASFPLQIHVIKDLVFHDTLLYGTALFNQAVG